MPRHVRGFNPVPRISPRQPNAVTVSEAVTGAQIQPNPYTQPVPTLAYDATGSLRNAPAVINALKANNESLTGQRGDLSNRAVTFKDLVDFGFLPPEVLASPNGVSADLADLRQTVQRLADEVERLKTQLTPGVTEC